MDAATAPDRTDPDAGDVGIAGADADIADITGTDDGARADGPAAPAAPAAPGVPLLAMITPAGRAARPWTAAATVAARRIRSFMRTPQMGVIISIQAAVFLVMFRYVFGKAIDLAGTVQVDVPYVDFLVPGYLISSVLFSGAGTAAGVASDIERGISDRLLSLPVARSALLAGRALADTVLQTWGLTIATTMAFLVGFRLHTGIPTAMVAFGLCILYGFSFCWLFICIGSFAGSAQSAQSLSLLILPLTAVSSTLVPVQSLPGWVQPFAMHQPVTGMTNTLRSLVVADPDVLGLDHGTAYWVGTSLLWCVGLVAVSVPLAVSRYRRS